jgi:hypothetical protein
MPLLPKQLRASNSGGEAHASLRRRSRAGSLAGGDRSRGGRPALPSFAAAPTVSSRLRATSTAARASYRLGSAVGSAVMTRSRSASAAGSAAPSRRASFAGSLRDPAAWGDMDERWSLASSASSGSGESLGSSSEKFAHNVFADSDSDSEQQADAQGRDFFVCLTAEADRRQVRLVDLLREVRACL